MFLYKIYWIHFTNAKKWIENNARRKVVYILMSVDNWIWLNLKHSETQTHFEHSKNKTLFVKFVVMKCMFDCALPFPFHCKYYYIFYCFILRFFFLFFTLKFTKFMCDIYLSLIVFVAFFLVATTSSFNTILSQTFRYITKRITSIK